MFENKIQSLFSSLTVLYEKYPGILIKIKFRDNYNFLDAMGTLESCVHSKHQTICVTRLRSKFQQDTDMTHTAVAASHEVLISIEIK